MKKRFYIVVIVLIALLLALGLSCQFFIGTQEEQKVDREENFEEVEDVPIYLEEDLEKDTKGNSLEDSLGNAKGEEIKDAITGGDVELPAVPVR